MTQRFLLITLAAAASLLPFTAHADGFGVSGSGAGYSGSGTITATDQGAGQFLITDIAGTGVQALSQPGTFNANDNLLFPSSTQYVDGAGFAFVIAGGGDTDNVDIFFDGSQYYAYIVDEGGNQQTVPVTFNLTTNATPSSATRASMAQGSRLANTPSTTQFDFSFSAADTSPTTPEPSSLILLGTGVTAVAGAVRKRRRSS